MSLIDNFDFESTLKMWWARIGITKIFILANIVGFALTLGLQLILSQVISGEQGRILIVQFFSFLEANSFVLDILGADTTATFYNLELWRYITSAFLHANLIHIVINIIALASIGEFIEKFYGWKELVIVYVIGAIGAGIATDIAFFATVILTGNFEIGLSAPSVGASGSLFAFLGLLLGQNWRTRRYGLELPISTNQLLGIVLINLMLGFLIPAINNSAHIGGLITGIVLAFILQPANNFVAGKGYKSMTNAIFYVSCFALAISFLALIGTIIINIV